MAQKVQTNFPLASQPDIIRAVHKDASYQILLNKQLQRVVEFLFGVRRRLVWEKETTMLAGLLYFSLTTGFGHQTLGEEYCDLVLAGPEYRPPTALRRMLMIFAASILPYAVSKVPLVSDQPHPNAKALNLGKRALQVLKQYMADVNLSFFYFFGTYYNLSKRLASIQYVLTRKREEGEDAPSFEVLGVLLFSRLLWDITSKIQQSRKVAEEESYQIEEENGPLFEIPPDLENPDAAKCILCLNFRTRPTCTPCGHLFCWNCIGEWCRNKPECPLCRQPFNPSALLCVVNHI
ncbi:Pex12 amino terminal region-domain-containing protein [Chytridium lagenaria]|nr:Pex12 amino terminal region-domain-containing protein [Chytridium lagenaria]